jgi:hypothetical protein
VYLEDKGRTMRASEKVSKKNFDTKGCIRVIKLDKNVELALWKDSPLYVRYTISERPHMCYTKSEEIVLFCCCC